MSATLFTAAGCARCSIAKRSLHETAIAFEELDALGEGKARFGEFYRAHRRVIFRGGEGIEFPILVDGERIRQGVAEVVAHAAAGERLDAFFRRSELLKGWVSGISLSTGNPVLADELTTVLGFLKKCGLKLQLETDGRNSTVLAHLLERGLGDRVVMDLKGPQVLYAALLGTTVSPEEVGRSMALAVKFPEARFETTVAPVARPEAGPETIGYLTPEEIAETARWLKEATGSHRQAYFLRAFDTAAHGNERFRSIEKLPHQALFRYRSAARRFQVTTEIEAASG